MAAAVLVDSDHVTVKAFDEYKVLRVVLRALGCLGPAVVAGRAGRDETACCWAAADSRSEAESAAERSGESLCRPACGLCSVPVAAATLSAASSLMKVSETPANELLALDGIANTLNELLLHENPILPSRTTNLIGQACRHSAKLLPTLQAHDWRLAKQLVACCRHADPGVRKLASFAVGNAVYHSESLCRVMGPTGIVPALLRQLDDDDDRALSNAAGALGNLVRLSSELLPELRRQEAHLKLRDVIMRTASKMQVGGTAPRVAAFTLGNFAVHSSYRQDLVQVADEVVAEFADARDDLLKRYVQRLQQKMAL